MYYLIKHDGTVLGRTSFPHEGDAEWALPAHIKRFYPDYPNATWEPDPDQTSTRKGRYASKDGFASVKIEKHIREALKIGSYDDVLATLNRQANGHPRGALERANAKLVDIELALKHLQATIEKLLP